MHVVYVDMYCQKGKPDTDIHLCIYEIVKERTFNQVSMDRSS